MSVTMEQWCVVTSNLKAEGKAKLVGVWAKIFKKWRPFWDVEWQKSRRGLLPPVACPPHPTQNWHNWALIGSSNQQTWKSDETAVPSVPRLQPVHALDQSGHLWNSWWPLISSAGGQCRKLKGHRQSKVTSQPSTTADSKLVLNHDSVTRQQHSTGSSSALGWPTDSYLSNRAPKVTVTLAAIRERLKRSRKIVQIRRDLP